MKENDKIIIFLDIEKKVIIQLKLDASKFFTFLLEVKQLLILILCICK